MDQAGTIAMCWNVHRQWFQDDGLFNRSRSGGLGRTIGVKDAHLTIVEHTRHQEAQVLKQQESPCSTRPQTFSVAETLAPPSSSQPFTLIKSP